MLSDNSTSLGKDEKFNSMKVGDLVEHSTTCSVLTKLIGHEEYFKVGLITEVQHRFYRVIPMGKIGELWYSEEELKLINEG